MIKNLLVLILGLMFFHTVRAQKDTTVLFINNAGQIVQDKGSASYFIMILSPDSSSGKKLYPVNGYFMDGKPKMVETVTIVENRAWGSKKSTRMLLQGPYLDFYPNGQRKTIENYVDGIQVGDITGYYPNGKRYSFTKLGQHGKLLLVDCRDSTGKVLAENGNGTWLKYDEGFKTIIDEGPVQDSLEEGEWKETMGNSIFKSVYKKGVLISTTDTTQVFSKVEKEPEFKGGGIASFYHFLGATIHYPSYAKENNIQGKALITFVVEKDGSLTHGKILKDPGGGIGDEALRAIMLSPKWIPGMQGGRPVRVQYTVPVSMTLSSDEK
jgi:hypothetical protein